MEVVLLLSAERDLQEAYNWVEEHRRGREQFFLQDVELRLENLQKYPLIGRLYRGRYRRLLIPRYLLVSSTLSSQTGLLFMRSPISGWDC
jgi:plasmid stabilization system protein ParE